MSNQQYCVHLVRRPESGTTTAEVRDFSLTVGCTANDPSVGFNAVETLLSAAGACITSSLLLVAANSKVDVGRVEVAACAVRQPDPPLLISASLEVSIASPAPDEKIDRIVQIASRNSTVISTLHNALELDLSWKRVE